MIDINATLVAQIINFLILMAILARFAYRPILTALTARRTHIEKSLDEAERELVTAKQMRAESEQQIIEARVQARAIIDEAINLGEQSREAIVQKAIEENTRLLKEAQEEIERNYQQAIVRLRAEVAVMAVAAAEKIIEKNLDVDTNTRLVKKFIKEFSKEKYGELA